MRWTLALPSDTAWCRSQTGQWCPVGSAPGTPCTMDSSSLGALVVSDPMLQLRRSRCRGRGALACARRRNDVTRCNSHARRSRGGRGAPPPPPMTGLGALCTLGPPTLTPVERNKACCFRLDKFVVVDKSTPNNVFYGRSVLPLQIIVFTLATLKRAATNFTAW